MAQQRKSSTKRKRPAATKSVDIDDSSDDVQAAANLVLEREAERIQRSKTRSRKQRQVREKAQLAAVHRMQQSIEVMKWCMVGIATVMFLGIVIAIWTLSAVHGQVEQVRAEVAKFQPQVERVVDEVTDIVDEVQRVRESLHNPMQSVGAAFGKELDEKLKSYLGTTLKGDAGDP